ncbi:hypothetical protein MGN70_001273 [Eutypa lata]|nr:hypothetical protein MGN70_001273 [Eutypa lata]
MKDLPVEIVKQICRNLTYDNAGKAGPTSLAALCLTSRWLYKIAQPYLYYQISLESIKIHNLAYLTRTALAHKDLAELTLQIKIGNVHDDMRTINEEDGGSLLARGAQSAGFILPKNWYNPVDPDSEQSYIIESRVEILIQLLLINLTRVKRLELAVSSAEEWTVLESARSDVKLPELKHVVLKGRDDDFDLGNVFGLFERAGNIETLSLTKCDAFSRNMSLESLTHLSVRNCRLPFVYMDRLVSFCGGLSHFLYIPVMVPGRGGFDAVSPNEVVGLLEYYGHHRTLRSLFLEYVLDPDDDLVESFMAFSKLRSVMLRYGRLMHDGDEAKSILNYMTWTLPATIEEFCVLYKVLF